jgi:hypothetical protein
MMAKQWYWMIGGILCFLPHTVVAEPTLITWHQTACQFIEAENGNQHYKAKTFDDCEKLNARTSKQRLNMQHVMTLSQGDYTIRVYNDDVPYELGFWLRGKGLGRLTLPSVSGGGIAVGRYKDYAIHLIPGEYAYSCPLNPTPDYTLQVTK